MATLKDLGRRLLDSTTLDEKIVGGIRNFVGPQRPISPIPQAPVTNAANSRFAPIQAIQRGLQQQELARIAGQRGQSNFNSMPVTANRLIQGSPIIPKVSLPRHQQASVFTPGKFAYNNLVAPTIESVANLPRTAVVVGKNTLGYGLKALSGTPYRNQDVLADIAAPSLNLATSAYGLKAAPQLIKQAGQSVLKQAIKRGAKEGFAYGGLQGLEQGLQENRNLPTATQQVGLSTLQATPNAVLGAIAGGTISGASSVVGQAFTKMVNAYKLKYPKATNKEAEKAVREYARNELGQFTGLVKKKGEPIFYGDLRESLGLPRNGGYDSGFIKPDEFIPGKITKGVSIENQKLGNRSIPSTKKTLRIQAETPQSIQPVSFSGKTVLRNIQSPQTTQPTPQSQKIRIKDTQPMKQSLENIIAEGKKQISSGKPQDNRSVKQLLSDTYTQWVDRYHPIVKASQKAKDTLKTRGAELRPEYDPEYLVRRLTGAGGIADSRFQTQLNPIIKRLDEFKIDKSDLDVYLANKRIAGFGQVGREVYGADPKKAQEIINALELKHGPNIKGIADELYAYQNKGFQEMIDAGFISPENAAIIKQQNPDYSPLYREMDRVNEYLGLPTRKTMQGSQPVLKIKGSTKKIESPLESIIGNTFSQRAAIEKNRVAKSIIGLQQITDMGFLKVKSAGDDTITVWNNGQKEYWQVGREIAEMAKGVNEESMNMVLKILQAPASLLRQGATGRNPEFMLPNIIRDQLDAGITSKYGYIPFVDYTRGFWEVLKNDVNNIFGTKLDDSIYQKWAGSGAKIDLGEMSGKKSIAAHFDEKQAKKGLFSWIGSGLDVMGRYSEQPTRVGLFKKAYQKTGNELISAMESRDATVDFARMGSKMKVANSIIPFLNVGVQGFDKLIRSVKNNPGKVLLNATLYGAMPAVATTLYNLSNFPEEYAEIPQYEKDSNFVLVKGRNDNGTVDYVTIPKGNIIPTISNPIQSFLEYAHGSAQQTFKEMATSVISSTIPVVGDGQSLQEVALKTVGSNMPQAIKPIAENLMNKSFYKYDAKKEQSKEIVPYYLQNKPKYEQSYEFTPSMYKKIGAIVNESPLKVQNLMEGYLAGYSKIPAQIVEMMVKTSRGDEISPNEKTLLRRFIKQTYPSGNNKQVQKPETPGLMERVTGKASASEGTVSLPTTKDDVSVLYKDATRIINNYQENKVKSEYGLVDKNLDEYQAEVDQAISLRKQIESERPEMVFDIGLDTYNKDGGAETGERANWAIKKINSAENKDEMIEKLYEGQVLTKSVVEDLNDKYDLKLTKYNYGDGFRYLSGSGGGRKPKKITIKTPSVKVANLKISLPKARPMKKLTIKKLRIAKKAKPKMLKLTA